MNINYENISYWRTPDDIEIFMYGFLSVCLKRGDEIYTMIATDGSAENFRKKI